MVDTPTVTVAPAQVPELDLEAGLARFGFDAFRPGQREAIVALIEQEKLLLVAPTGGGKSLTYQLPATLLPGTTLVVSPLIALMADQVGALDALGVAATYIASTLPGDEVRKRMAKMAAGEYDLVYVAPERLTFSGFRGLLSDISCPLVAIDEAHCISEWGHDFRPEYMQIGELLRFLPKARVLACTATATPVVRDEIIARLGLGPDTPQHVRGFARPNLALRAAEIMGKRDREQHVDALLAEALGKPRAEQGCAIIYAPTRKQTEAEATRLEGQGWRVMGYHAGMSPKIRDRVGKRFADGTLEVVVATNAFGMGIDRPDVRAVIHLGPPGSIEAYYQEVGRAGRDGERAYGLLLTSPRDMPLRRGLLESPTDGERPDPAIVEHKWGMFLELMRWAEGGSCRHDAILRYFGDEAEVLSGCGICDVCHRLADGAEDEDPEEAALVVRKALSGVARIHGRLGLTAAIKLLKGAKDDRLSRYGLDQTRTFGVLAEHPEEWLGRLLRRCVTAGWVGFTVSDRPIALLTEDGEAVMRGQRPARLLLPAQSRARPTRSRRPARGGGVGVDDLDATGQAVFEALRAHRMTEARAQEVPPYVVASDRTLREIAMLRPRDLDQLLMCHGIGPAKADKYGEGFIEVVARAVAEHTPDG